MQNNTDWLEMYGTSVSHTKCYAKATEQEILIYNNLMTRIASEVGNFVDCAFIERINVADEYALLFGLTAPGSTVKSDRRHRQLLEIAEEVSRECEMDVSIGITFSPQPNEGTFLIFNCQQALDLASQTQYDRPRDAVVALLSYLCLTAEEHRPETALEVFINLCDAYCRIGEWRLALTCLDEAEQLFRDLNGSRRDENCHSGLDRLLGSFMRLSVPERGVALVKEVMPNLPPVEIISPYDSEEIQRAFDINQSLAWLEEMISEYAGKNMAIATWGEAQRAS